VILAYKSEVAVWLCDENPDQRNCAPNL